MEDARPAEIEEAIVSIARATFARNARLLFGGHPSVSPLVASIAGEYFPPDPHRRVRPVVTFQSEFFRGFVPDETWLLLRMGWSTIEWAPAVDGDREASLELMRRWMLNPREAPADIVARNELDVPRAMIAVGGMEGVLDETRIFRESWPHERGPRPPIFAFTSGGGAARECAHELADGVYNLEQIFYQNNAELLPDQSPLTPYGAMVQWLFEVL